MARFIVKYIRPFWAYPLGGLFAVWYAIVLQFSAKARAAYSMNKFRWDNIKTLEDLQAYFKEAYKYKFDGPFGLLDHANFSNEFFLSGGDCDDMAFYACKKLIQMNYCAVVYWIYGNGPKNWHFDCIFEMFDDGWNVAFNYGNDVSFQKQEDFAAYSKLYGWKKPCKWVKL